MKLPVPKIAILALATCVGLIHKAESAANKEAAQKPMDINRAEKSSGFETANTHHGHHGHHHHNYCDHHHKKPEPEPEPESEFCEQIDLVCDRVVIDSITCPSVPRSTPLLMESVVPSGFEAANNDKKKKCKSITSQRFVNMAFPCYNTPQECASGPNPGDIIIDPFPIASQGDDTNDDTEEADVTDELDVAGEDDDEDDIVEDDDGETPDSAQSLQKRNNDRKHHDRHHNKKHDHKNHQHHHRKKHGHKKIIHQKHHNKGGKQGGHKKDQHPWLGLCTSSGEFCGHGLFGCDFVWSGVYICSHVGAVPEFRGICSDGCEHGGCTGGPDPLVTTDGPVTIITREPTTATTTTTTEPEDKILTTTPTVTSVTTTATSTGTTTNTPPPDRCLCPANTAYCGVSLSALPGCKNVYADVIYDCTGGVDSEATELKGCSGTTKCIQYDTGAECVVESTNTCKCTEVGTFCGTSFDATLCKDLLTTGGTNTVYTCKKVGDAPEVTQACPARQLCLTKGNTAECGSSTCDCTGTKNLCSSEFKETCNLVANSIYSCSISGEPELVSTCEDNEQCVSLTEGAVCASNECKCPKIGTVCGVSFPSTCNLIATALYDCKEVDGKPEITEDCAPGKCVTASVASTADEAEEGMMDFQETTGDAGDADRCILPCTCTSTEDVCGSRFGEDCKLNPNALHTCSGVGEVPEETEVCESGSCLVNPGADECASIEDPCICSEKGSFCGRTFASECEFDPERIYVCAADSGTPMPFTNCTTGCDGTPLAVCNTETLIPNTNTAGPPINELIKTTSTTNGTPTTTTTAGTVTTTQSSTTQTTRETAALIGPTSTTDGTVTTTQSSTTQTTRETAALIGPTSTTTTTESATTTTTNGPTTGTSTSTPPIDTTTTTTAGPTSETTTTTTDEVSSTTTTTGTEATTATTTTTTTTATTASTTASITTIRAEATAAITTTTTTTTTATTTTTTTALTPTTPGSLCDTVVNTFKGVIDTAFDTITGFIPMIPEPIKSLISPVIGTLEDFKTIVYDALKDAGTVASTAASALSQLIAITTTFKTSITNLIPGVGGLVDLVLDVLSKVASSAQDVATCLGAPKNCNGLLVILGYILKAALPLIKSQVAGLGSLVSGLLSGVIATLESTIDKMISGASDAASSLKGVVDTIAGLASFLPAEVKLPLDILKAILDTVDQCNKGL